MPGQRRFEGLVEIEIREVARRGLLQCGDRPGEQDAERAIHAMRWTLWRDLTVDICKFNSHRHSSTSLESSTPHGHSGDCRLPAFHLAADTVTMRVLVGQPGLVCEPQSALFGGRGRRRPEVGETDNRAYAVTRRGTNLRRALRRTTHALRPVIGRPPTVVIYSAI